jgi:hypothetical protein
MKSSVFVHTNHRQMVGALVSQYSMRRNSAHSDAFDVRLIHTEDYPFLGAKEGQLYLRDGLRRVWLNDDLQSFTPLRFMPPELMGYTGRALVVDPDVFAVGDVHELLARDMRDKAVLCRTHSGVKRTVRGSFASSVMLLDCARLTHWQVRQQVEELFDFSRDYTKWIGLQYEAPETIGLIEAEWNDFDRLTERTRMLHNTRRKTQPWKTGLPVDFRPVEHFPLFPPFGWLMTARRKLFGEYALLGHYSRHPDSNQEALFFALLRECVEADIVREDFLRKEMRRNHVRHDALELLAKAPAVDELLARLAERRAA